MVQCTVYTVYSLADHSLKIDMGKAPGLCGFPLKPLLLILEYTFTITYIKPLLTLSSKTNYCAGVDCVRAAGVLCFIGATQ